MSGWAVRRITELPVVSDGEPDDPVWCPLQHALGIDTFGANVFVARRAEQQLVEEHDERESGQQELYLLLDGAAVFLLDGEEARLERGDALAAPIRAFAAQRGRRRPERCCSSSVPRTARSHPLGTRPTSRTSRGRASPAATAWGSQDRGRAERRA